MATAKQVLDVFRRELGTVEAADGSTKYHRAYGLPSDQPWCAVFVWWCFRQVGASDLIHPKTAYTPTLADWFRLRGAFDRTPRVGDLVFYNWPDSLDRIQHVGIVEAVEPTAIVAIEGNTSTSNQSNGGQVMRRRRARNSSIVGYGHPAYTGATTMTVVHRTQAAVHVTVDGIWGPGTDHAVSAVRSAAFLKQLGSVPELQRAVGADDDGIWGPASRAALVDTVRELQAAWAVAVDGDWGPATDRAWSAVRTQHLRSVTAQPVVAAPAAPVNPPPAPPAPTLVGDVSALARELAPLVARELIDHFRQLPPAA